MDSDDSESMCDKNAPDDITSVIVGLGMEKIKASFFIFILFIFICSDVFVDRILSNKNNTYVKGRTVNSKGVIAQGLLLSLGYIAITIFIENDYI